MHCISVIKKLLLLIVVVSNNIEAKQYDIDNIQNIQYSGYVGFRSIISTAKVTDTFSNNNVPELGLNIIYNNGNFQIFNQFRYGTNIETISVYNFAQYTFNIKDDLNISIRGGKLRHELGLYNTTRINPTTRNGVIMPQSIYWDSFNEFLTSGIGVEAILQYKDFELTYTIDKPTVIDSKQTVKAIYVSVLNDTNVQFGDHQNASLTYTPSNTPLTIKANWTWFNLGSNTSAVTAKVFPNIANKDIVSEILAGGAEYRFDKLTLSGEIFIFRSAIKDWTDVSTLSRGYSVGGRYQITPNIDIYSNYNDYNPTSRNALPSPTPWIRTYKDLSVGFNYHIDNWMFQLEGHHIKGARVIDSSDVGTSPGDYKDWWLTGFNVVYSFR